MIDPKLVENWDIVFALTHKGCGKFATYVWNEIEPYELSYWSLAVPCPEGCTSSPPSYSLNQGAEDTGVAVECTGTCCDCGGVQCEPSETCCDHVCVDLQTDHDHCNSCTIACGVDQECCAGECKNIYEDSNNCNGCGIVCPAATPTCCNGECCTTSGCCFVDDILTCIDVINNHDHCGTCNNKCENDETCCNEECVLTISFQTDPTNCGGCGIACEPSETCCSGSCIDVMGSDTSNCGACGRACQYGEICLNGACKDPCAANDCSWTWDEPQVMGCCIQTFCQCNYATTPPTCLLDGPNNIYHPSGSGESWDGTECTEIPFPEGFVCDPSHDGMSSVSFTEEPCREGCCKHWNCQQTGENTYAYVNTSSNPSSANCANSGNASSGGSTGNIDLPCNNDTPTNRNGFYDTWSLGPCTTVGCCYSYICRSNRPFQDQTYAEIVTPDNSKEIQALVANFWELTGTVSTNIDCSTGDGFCCNSATPCVGAIYSAWSPEQCLAPAFHALSDEDENGTVSALAGSWSQTAQCPQGCNCPETAPTANGTANGQVISHECVSCFPPCQADQDCCDGVCKNTLVDTENCGDCGTICEPPGVSDDVGEVCCNGECCGTFSSERDNRCCTEGGNPTCADVMNDPNHCGECQNFCGPDQVCCDGECADWCCFPACVEGQLCCDGTGTCRDVLADEANCGACDFACAVDPALNIQCCNGVCKPLAISVENCGACENFCTGINPSCCNGNCCPAENTCCFGTNCVNRNTDNNNCGVCGTVCTSGHSCVNGMCIACDPPCLTAGTACCNNSCIDILSDESNCGRCGYACASGLTCCGGVCKNTQMDMYNCGECGIECPQGINQINLWQCCSGVCRNLKSDPENCGTCGAVCPEPPGDTFTVPKCQLGHCAEPYCTCEPEGMPATPGPNDVAFPATCSGNTVNCDGSCYFNAVGGGWVLYEAPGLEQPFASCGQEPDYTYCADDRISCVDDKLACVGDIYFCVNNIEGQDMATYCIPKASFDPLTQAKIGEYIGAENCAAGCSGDGSECDPACGNGKTCCSSTCVDMQTDKNNCGSCGTKCADDEACKDGTCAGCSPPCAAGETCCEGGTTCCEVCCEDACCPSGESCVEGVCVTCTPACTAGQTCCGGSCCPAGRICCDQTCCAAGEFCENGHCATCNPVCYPDETCCSGTCIRWKCGECPNACASAEIVCCGLVGQEVCCPEGQTCVGNVCYGCTPPCSESQDCCDEVCTEVGTDTDCSGCDNACGEGTKCCDKVCTATGTDTNCSDCGDACAEGQSCCDDLCTEIGTDTNCSGCGDACTGGKCCEGVCKETQTDNENCGDCENVCDTAASEKCVDGTCVTCDPPCTGLDVCCDLTCCKVCCDGICCASGKFCVAGVCTGCEPECLGAGETCCASAGPAGPEPEEGQAGACCPSGVVCCNGNCCGDGTASMYCCDNKTCCYEGITCCDGICCAAGQICENGLCADCNPACFPDEKCCPNADGSGECIRWQCGDCPNACTRFQTCTNDVCCDAVTEGPLAGQTGVGCGTVCCDPGIVCCRDICCLDPEEECCDGFCVKTDTNQNCGSCNHPCVAPETCCNGVCRSDFSDSDNCGGCEFACPDNMLCCVGNFGNLTCTSLSWQNCGGCGVICPEGQECCDGGTSCRPTGCV